MVSIYNFQQVCNNARNGPLSHTRGDRRAEFKFGIINDQQMLKSPFVIYDEGESSVPGLYRLDVEHR